jgi:hypothetical protein
MVKVEYADNKFKIGSKEGNTLASLYGRLKDTCVRGGILSGYFESTYGRDFKNLNIGINHADSIKDGTNASNF